MTAPLYDQASDLDRMTRVMDVCGAMSNAALSLRLGLLREGWPVEHRLCLALDDAASDWSVQWEAQRRTLFDYCRDQGVLIGSSR